MVKYRHLKADELWSVIGDISKRDFEEMVDWPVELGVDIDFYREVERLGKLRLFSAWDGEKIVGYAIFFINKHRHFKNQTWAIVDDFWLDAEYRIGRTALRFFEYMEKELMLSAPNITAIMLGSRVGHPAAARLFAHMGYAPLDMSHIKFVEGKNA